MAEQFSLSRTASRSNFLSCRKDVRNFLLLSPVFFSFLLPFFSQAQGVIDGPFHTRPIRADAIGNAASRNSGGYFQDPDRGFNSLIIWIGTETVHGSLILDFAAPFGDGPGNDFALATSSEGWGGLADAVLIQFLLDGSLQGSLVASGLIPGAIMEYEMPGDFIVANRMIVNNTTPDPPGINELATMAFIDAAVAYPVPEPSTAVLLLLAIGSLLCCARIGNEPRSVKMQFSIR